MATVHIERSWDGSPTFFNSKLNDGDMFHNTNIGFGDIIIDKDFIDEVSYIILNHSEKELLKTTNNHNFIIMMEADLLDEEGALGILWDLLSAGYNETPSYYSALDELNKHSAHILSQDFMVSKTAKFYWNNKKRLVLEFIESINDDLFI